MIAGLSTGLGSLIAFSMKRFMKHRYISLLMGFSAGVIIQISFLELLFSAIEEVGFLSANISFFLGIICIATLEFLIPHEYEAERFSEIEKKSRKLMRTGLLVSIGIAIHNFPEGILTLFGTLKELNLGFVLFVAVALHNIPEGIAISVPIFYATKNRKKAFLWSLFAGISEPIGALLGFLFLLPFLDIFLLSLSLAFVAGIMVFISFNELLPVSLSHGEAHLAITSLFLGMAVMTSVLLLLKLCHILFVPA